MIEGCCPKSVVECRYYRYKLVMSCRVTKELITNTYSTLNNTEDMSLS